MSQIVKNLEDPAWWFTGLFFVLLGILLTKLVFDWGPFVWGEAYSLMPRIVQRISRHAERRALLTVKLTRQHEVKINNLISRYWSLATLSIMVMLSGLIYYSTIPTNASPLLLNNKLFFLIPIYVGMLLVIREKRILNRAINAHILWEKSTTKRSSKDTKKACVA